MKKFINFIWEVVKIVIISLAIIIPIRYFLIQPFFVSGVSMVPSFDDGQYLVIDEISYRFNEPQRGEVIVFKYPKTREGEPNQYYIKRIIGLPNETVEVKDSQVVIYNEGSPEGFVLDESGYLLGDVNTPGQVYAKLGQDEYFVLGDNRSHSSDSRHWGSLPENNIVGRVWLRAWPINEARAF